MSKRLPPELLLYVVEHIHVEDKTSLLNLLVSCRTFHAIAEPRFYCDAVFMPGPPNDTSRLVKSLKGFYEQISKENARLAPFVHRFTFTRNLFMRTLCDVSIIIDILPLLVNLEYFRWSPFDTTIHNTSIFNTFRSDVIRTFILDTMPSEDSPPLREFLESHPLISHLEVPFVRHIDPLPPSSLPHLRKFSANFPVTWAFLPKRHITHLSLIMFECMTHRAPTLFKLSIITHFQAPMQVDLEHLLELISHMPHLRCLVYPLDGLSMSLSGLSQFFASNQVGSLQKLEYFAILPRCPFGFEADMALVLFKNVPSLRIFDSKDDDCPRFTRYHHDGHTVVMPLPMFQGTWPSDRELSRMSPRVQAYY